MQRRSLHTRSLYRSVRNRVNPESQPRTSIQSSYAFRIKKYNVMEDTMAETTASKLTAENNNGGRHNWFRRSVNSIVNKESLKEHDRVEKFERSVSFFEGTHQLTIPAFEFLEKEVENSDFALLTPFLKPLNEIQWKLKQSQKVFKSSKAQFQLIKYELKVLKDKQEKDLNEIETIGRQNFERIANALKRNSINDQQRKLRNKREIGQLKKQDSKNREKFTKMDQFCTNLQSQMFNSTPFNLQVQDQQGFSYI